ncbi:Acetoacetate decarboxylase [Fusarium oxysporum f. sp. albedinis]|nr:Acetoacetate decarboxylase [Fusarium oxysporum f. sp. albedinis]
MRRMLTWPLQGPTCEPAYALVPQCSISMAGGVLGSRQRYGCQANGSLRLAGSHIVSLVTGENGFQKQEQCKSFGCVAYPPVGGGVGCKVRNNIHIFPTLVVYKLLFLNRYGPCFIRGACHRSSLIRYFRVTPRLRKLVPICLMPLSTGILSADLVEASLNPSWPKLRQIG